MYARAATAYRKVYLESAPPVRVLDELYGRLLADIAEARAGIVASHPAAKGGAISHGLAIVSELVAALDRDAAPELCDNLARLYGFVKDRLSEANAQMDARPLAAAERVVNTLRESFRTATGGRP